MSSIFPEKTQDLPASLGYSMPPEWERHEATWLSWPHNGETWPGKRLGIVRDIYLQMLEALLPFEKVHLLAKDTREEDEIRKFLASVRLDTHNLIIHKIPTADTWIRDYGPTFITRREDPRKAFCKWIFNAWGGKYAPLIEDTHVFENSQLCSNPVFDAGFILEGGSIEVNGAGTCLTTEQCLLNPNRNGFSREEIESKLRNYLGVSQILWLGEGIVGDDTDGHIDDIARFTSSNVILAAFEDDETDENHFFLKENWERLKQSFNAKGKPWELVKLPMPGKIVDDGNRLPASYANFYIGNQTVLLPMYGHSNDDRAERILRELFPKRQIVPIACNALVYGLGAIHCVTQQEPA